MANILKRIGQVFSRRATANGPNDPIYGSFTSIFKTHSGANVSPEAALHVSAVFACIRVLAESVASLPLKVYKRTKDGGKEEATAHPLYRILHDAPNEFNTSYEFRETLMTHLNMRGNSYAVKEFNGAGVLSNLVTLNPAKTTPEIEKDGSISYVFSPDNQKPIKFKQEDIWHVKGLSTDGIMGLSPISIARESIGLAIATEAYGARLFKNNAQTGGLIKYPGKLSEQARERLVNNWQRMHTGDNAWKVALLEEGLDYVSVGFSNDDAQFLETRLFQIEDIARIFRVPGVLIGHPDKTSTYASAEQFFLSFVVHTIRPWLVRIEQSANMHLLNERERKNYFVEFQMDALLRGDILSRFQAYAIARQNKWMSANEVRKKENLNPLGPEGDKYENPNIQTNDQTDQGIDQGEGEQDAST